MRQLCSQAVLLFLLDYPLSPKRIKQHLNFILENLAYEHESGRLSAIEMLGTVVAKFPDGVSWCPVVLGDGHWTWSRL